MLKNNFLFRLVILSILTLLLSIIGCKQKKDTEDTPMPDISGEWRTSDSSPKCFYYIQFYSNRHFKYRRSEKTMTGTYDMDNQKIGLTLNNDDYFMSSNDEEDKPDEIIYLITLPYTDTAGTTHLILNHQCADCSQFNIDYIKQR